jgi:hypothetical protein
MTATMRKVFTVREAARLLKISTSRVRRLCIDHEVGDKVNDRLRLLSDRDVRTLAKRNRDRGRPKEHLPKKSS